MPDPLLENFSGVVPLFPLPNVVFFPGTRLPLQIFEPRYRQMLQDAQRGEQLIAVVLLREGWDKNYFGNPPIHEVAGLGKLTHVKRLQSGRYFIQLAGLCRARIEEEFDRGKPYRLARVSLLDDRVDEAAQAHELRDRALQTFNSMLKHLTDFPGELLNTRRRLPTGLTLDILAHHLPSEPGIKQQLLEETDVMRRGRLMIEIAERLPSTLPTKVQARFRVFPKPSVN